MKTRVDFSDDEIGPDVSDTQERPGDWANPDRHLGMRDAPAGAFKSENRRNEGHSSVVESGLWEDEISARPGEVPGDDVPEDEVVSGEVFSASSSLPKDFSKADEPVGAVKTPAIKGYIPGALKLIISQDRALASQ
jgi:hypothetical protein